MQPRSGPPEMKPRWQTGSQLKVLNRLTHFWLDAQLWSPFSHSSISTQRRSELLYSDPSGHEGSARSEWLGWISDFGCKNTYTLAEVASDSIGALFIAQAWVQIAFVDINTIANTGTFQEWWSSYIQPILLRILRLSYLSCGWVRIQVHTCSGMHQADWCR